MTQARAGAAIHQSRRTPSASSIAGRGACVLMWLKKSFAGPGVAATRSPVFKKVAETPWHLQPGQPEPREVEKAG